MNSLAVFCGSKSGSNPMFLQEAHALGKAMALHNIKLVYGGGSVGLMGAVADSVLANGGFVTGIIPEVLVAWEQQHKGIQDLQVVTDMHIRKKLMYELCDAAIILPGGNGTLDELFEMLTWNTLKIHNKKIFLLNVAGFYNHLIAHIETMTEQGFLYENWQERLVVVENTAAIFDFLALNTL
jgi:uncharacterized protein (TIGR00730 family)